MIACLVVDDCAVIQSLDSEFTEVESRIDGLAKAQAI